MELKHVRAKQQRGGKGKGIEAERCRGEAKLKGSTKCLLCMRGRESLVRATRKTPRTATSILNGSDNEVQGRSG